MLLYKLSIPNTLFHAYLLIVGIVSQLFCNTGAILIFLHHRVDKKTTIPESYVRPLLHEWELKNVFTYAAHISNYRMVSRPSRTVTIRRWEYEIFKWRQWWSIPSGQIEAERRFASVPVVIRARCVLWRSIIKMILFVASRLLTFWSREEFRGSCEVRLWSRHDVTTRR